MTKIKKIPKVSILIANYNGQNYVKRCIKSCLNQTYDNVEVIFVDDNSTDNSSKIAKKFKKIKFYQKKNQKKTKHILTPRTKSKLTSMHLKNPEVIIFSFWTQMIFF